MGDEICNYLILIFKKLNQIGTMVLPVTSSSCFNPIAML